MRVYFEDAGACWWRRSSAGPLSPGPPADPVAEDPGLSTLDRARLDATGIGFAGIDGAWWLPATRAVRWPPEAATRLERIARAVFRLLDAVGELYAHDPALAALLDERVPVELRALALYSPVLALRPDFQLVEHDGELDFVATELEICPSAQVSEGVDAVQAPVDFPLSRAQRTASSSPSR